MDITVEKLDIGEIDSKNFENKDDISFGIIITNRKDGEFISKNFESEDNTLGIIFTNRIDNIKDNNSDNKKENLEIKKGGGLEKLKSLLVLWKQLILMKMKMILLSN